MRLKIIAHNQKSLYRLVGLEAKFKAGIYQAYIDIAKYLKSTVKKDLNDEKHGRLYIRRLAGRVVRHRASAPGEPPATFTGKLERSISTKTSGYRDLDFSAGGKDVNYAGFLEDGTRRMAKRPYMIRSVKQNERNTIEAFYRHISVKINEA